MSKLKGLTLRFNGREEFISAEQFNKLFKLMLKEGLVIYENPAINKYSVEVDFQCGYHDLTCEDDMFPSLEVTKYNPKSGLFQTYRMTGYPECFEELGFDLQFVSDFFSEDLWYFNASFEHDYEYDHEDCNITSPELVQISLYNADTPNVKHIVVNGKEEVSVVITDFFDKEVKDDLVDYVYNDLHDSIVEEIESYN